MEPVPKRRRWVWPLVTAVLIVAALLVPDSWFGRVQTVYGTAEQMDPFSPEIMALDEALLKGTPIPNGPVFQTRFPLVQTRRLLSQGRVASESIPELVSLLRESEALIAKQTSWGAKEATRAQRDVQIKREFPRLHPDRVRPTLDKLDRDRVAGVPQGTMSDDCSDCHQASETTPDVQSVDSLGLWPLVPAESISGMPTLTDSLELAAYQADLGDEANCLECHKSHNDPDFGVDLKQRQSAMGLWIDVYRVENAVYVGTKVKNSGAGHRAPGGYIGRGYALVVEVFEGHERNDHPLPFFFGESLPKHLQNATKKAGTMYWRELVKPDGTPTSDHRMASDLRDDSRLLGQRFVDNRFVFTLPEPEGQTPYYVIVRLVYLPDVMTWDGSEDVEVRVFKTG